ncbi:hypothetical protein Sjap_003685 [Stephania japonica]|uniref:Arf-GAP domain-containing protein n=1 Tax=Stephania japonica TaxID=461633 RepID=A0AAP0PV95_9MAGN
MNEKANVSKELDARHKKILEGLLKLPENRICADCKSKGPRWASVNLGIFICMQCSGIHRSLGVRSATLDTWLPEQVAFIQSMGNEKANRYWEAELPPNYDRVGIENFIRAKYEDKRWTSRNERSKSPLEAHQEKVSIHTNTSGIRDDHGSMKNVVHSSEKQRNLTKATGKSSVPVAKITLPPPPKASSQVFNDPNPAPALQSSEHVVSQDESTTMSKETALDVTTKVDFATDLFGMLSTDGPNENGSTTSPPVDNAWAGFESAEAESSTGKTGPAKPVETETRINSGVEDLFNNSSSVTLSAKPVETKTTQRNSGVEDLFKDSSSITLPAKPVETETQRNSGFEDLFKYSSSSTLPAKPVETESQRISVVEDLFKDSSSITPPLPEKNQTDVNSDIMSLFEKSNMMSPFAMHQQQLAALAQQQSLLMAAATIAGDGTKPTATNNELPYLNGVQAIYGNLLSQNWPKLSNQVSGLKKSVDGNDQQQNFLQIGNFAPAQASRNAAPSPTSSMHPTESDPSSNGVAVNELSKPDSLTPSSSVAAIQSGKDYDFSSLTQGMFSKS